MKSTSPDSPPPSQTRLRIDRARIRFRDQQGLLSVLEIDLPEGRDVIRMVHRALWSLRMQIVDAETRCSGGRRVHKLYLVEFDGGPVPAARRLEIQAEIVALTGDLLAGDEHDEYETLGVG